MNCTDKGDHLRIIMSPVKKMTFVVLEHMSIVLTVSFKLVSF